MKPTKTRFTKIIDSTQAFHKVDDSRGVGDVTLCFVLKGPHGAVQFLMGTGWHLPETHQWWVQTGKMFGNTAQHPKGWDLGYHALVPNYEGQEPRDAKCPYIGRPCYYDGSSLAAEPVLDILLRKGVQGVWERLRGYYEEVFAPVVVPG